MVMLSTRIAWMCRASHAQGREAHTRLVGFPCLLMRRVDAFSVGCGAPVHLLPNVSIAQPILIDHEATCTTNNSPG